MTMIDANLLLYAYNADAPQHSRAVQWLTDLFDSDDIIGLAWTTIWAFVRICTNPRIWDNPLAMKDALGIVTRWLATPDVVIVQPGPRHWDILQQVILENSVSGPLVTDAVLAALAMEHGALLASTDQDFSRFDKLRWTNPLKS
ncbi:MAG: type II toxin-antitoxin system VapC family toxin [Acidobacteriaceae bacterium]|nr:type II toxin-antitoxin system VapC family toxin [Acidobacteriaceae bacterium]